MVTEFAVTPVTCDVTELTQPHPTVETIFAPVKNVIVNFQLFFSGLPWSHLYIISNLRSQ